MYEPRVKPSLQIMAIYFGQKKAAEAAESAFYIFIIIDRLIIILTACSLSGVGGTSFFDCV